MLLLVVLLLVSPPPPPHLVANTSSIGDRSSRSGGFSDVEGSSFTAFHIGLIFLGVVLCVIMCAVPWDSIKCCVGGRSSNSAGEQQQQQPTGSEASADEEEGSRRGLSKEVIQSFKVVRYHTIVRQQQQQQEQQIECAICLAEFRNGQKVRLLPQCNHGFHKRCIGTWLLSHTSCPICRNPLLIRSPEKGAARRQQQQTQQHQEDVHQQEHTAAM